jgi:hypothetical protein
VAKKRGPKEKDPFELIERMHAMQKASPGLRDRGAAAKIADGLPGDRKKNIDRLRKRVKRERLSGSLDPPPETEIKVANVRALAISYKTAITKELANRRAALMLVEREADQVGIPMDGMLMDAYAEALKEELGESGLELLAEMTERSVIRYFFQRGIRDPEEMAERYAAALKRREEIGRRIGMIDLIRDHRNAIASLLRP